MAACCPPGSIGGAAPPKDYTNRGSDVTLSTGCTAYAVGDTSATKGIVVAPDIFGSDSGRTKQICDSLADSGFRVIMPEYWRGNPALADNWVPILLQMPKLVYRVKTMPTESFLGDMGAAHAWLTDGGTVTKVGIMSFCFGGWVSLHATAAEKWGTSKYACAVAHHPSLKICSLKGEQREDLLDQVGCPQLWLTGGNDPDDVKPNGLAHQRFTTKLGAEECKASMEFVEYAKMDHGWVNRGDVSKEDIKAEVVDALKRTLEFFNKYCA